MKRSTLGIALLAIIAPVLAQQASTQRTADGSIAVSKSDRSAGTTQPGAMPPLVIVSSKRQTGTDWVAPATGELSVGTSTGRQTLQLNPKAGDVNVNRGAAVAAPTVVRNGATSRWIPQSRSCPPYYTGSITWEAEEISTITSAWAPSGAVRSYVESCTAVVETRWVAQNGGCPAGYSGSNTWEAEERRVGGGAWAATGAVRSQNNSCTAPPPPPPPPPPPEPEPVPQPEPEQPAVCVAGAAKSFRASTAVARFPNYATPPDACTANNRGRFAQIMWNVSSFGAMCNWISTTQCTSQGWKVYAGRSGTCDAGTSAYPAHLSGNFDVVIEVATLAQQLSPGFNGEAAWANRAAGDNAVVAYGCTVFPD